MSWLIISKKLKQEIYKAHLVLYFLQEEKNMQYVYIFTFLLSIPFVWNILFSLRFEGIFQKGKVWQIRAAYVIATIALSHLLAEAINTFVINIYALF